jgi:hypothetical protein
MRTAVATLALLLTGGLLACGGEDKGETPGLSMNRQTNLEERQAETPQPTDTTVNQSPRVLKVQLNPESPLPGERVNAVVSAADPERNSIELVYRWRVNGKSVGGNKPRLMVPNVPKSSIIELEVVARNGISASAPMLASVRVGNQTPRIVGASIEPPGEITAAHPVSVRPKAMDPDRDGLSYRYTWRVNGRVVADDTPVLSTDHFKRGDTVSFTVVASDGQTESEPLVTKPMRVANAAPRITSRPGGLNADGVLQYQVKAEDADGDTRFRYRLVKGPKGMEIDLFSGELAWTPIPSQAGKHPVEIEVDDMRGGNSGQIFELDVGFDAAPAAPAASKKP